MIKARKQKIKKERWNDVRRRDVVEVVENLEKWIVHEMIALSMTSFCIITQATLKKGT